MTYRKFTAKTAAAAIAAASTISLTAPVAAQETYTIQRGDELGSIARRIEGVQVRWRDLCSLNSDVIANCDLLEIGTVIALPDGAQLGALRERAPSTTIDEQEVGRASMPELRAGSEAGAVYSLTYGEGGRLLGFQTTNGHTLIDIADGVRVAGHVNNPSPAGVTGGAYLRLPDEFEAAASGMIVRVTLTVTANFEGRARASYSTNEVGRKLSHSYITRPRRMG